MVETGFLNRGIDGDDRRFCVYVPADYDPGRLWPVILFLHGAGEGGQDGREHFGQACMVTRPSL